MAMATRRMLWSWLQRAMGIECRRLKVDSRVNVALIHTIGSNSDADEERTGFTEDDEQDAQTEEKGRRVVIIWDITTSKPPLSMDPYVAALRVVDMAEVFGHVVDKAAYAEPRVPVTDNRPRTYYEEKFIDQQFKPHWHQDLPGQYEENYQYKCGYCGRTLRNHQSLYKHFKTVHATERTRRIHRLNRIQRGQRRDEYAIEMADKEKKYHAALREIVMPRILDNDALCKALIRAKFMVRLVTEKPLRHLFITAQESAIINHLWQAAWLHVAVIVLVSDSCRFLDFIELARGKGVRFVAISEGYSELRCHVDLFVSWEEVEHGRGLVWMAEADRAWFPNIRWFAKKKGYSRRDIRRLDACTEAEYESP